MGGSSSTEIGGVRVFKVSQGSPAAEAGLEVFFDFILEVNGAKMDPNYQQKFSEGIQAAENVSAKLLVYNTRAHTTREVIVMPRKWAGKGLLGATVRFDTTEPSETNGIRVLEVFPNSPAAHAGLVPFQDYLLGTAQSVFRDIDELTGAVTANLNQRLEVYVYNVDTETVRELTLVANHEWGGEGCIGCELGTGLLHRIPAPRRPLGAAGAALGMPEPLQAMPVMPGMAPGAAVPPGFVPSGPPGGAALPGVVAATVVGGVAPAAPAPPAPPAAGAPLAANPGAVAPPAERGIPPVPMAAAGQGGLPGISVGGAWNPSMMMGATPGASAAPAAPGAPAGDAGAALPQVRKLAAQWPPLPAQDPAAEQAVLPVAAVSAVEASPAGNEEGVQAPHATPVGGVPPPNYAYYANLSAAASAAAEQPAESPPVQEQVAPTAQPNPGVALL